MLMLSPPNTEVENVSVGHVSRQEPLILNPPIPNSMNVLLETIS